MCVEECRLLVEPVVEPIHVANGLAAENASLLGVPVFDNRENASAAWGGFDLGNAILRAVRALRPAGAVRQVEMDLVGVGGILGDAAGVDVHSGLMGFRAGDDVFAAKAEIGTNTANGVNHNEQESHGGEEKEEIAEGCHRGLPRHAGGRPCRSGRNCGVAVSRYASATGKTTVLCL